MQVVLVMFKGDGERRSFSVARDVTLIGRREDCDLRIPLGDVSRKHCRILKQEDELRVEDLGSSNGTFVNDQRIQESAVHAGDALRVGPVNFVVQIDGVPPDNEIDTPATSSGSTAGAPGDVTSTLNPTAASDAGNDDFDPMAALKNPADSESDFVINTAENPEESVIVNLDEMQDDDDK